MDGDFIFENTSSASSVASPPVSPSLEEVYGDDEVAAAELAAAAADIVGGVHPEGDGGEVEDMASLASTVVVEEAQASPMGGSAVVGASPELLSWDLSAGGWEKVR